jgi:hypothetical protein
LEWHEWQPGVDEKESVKEAEPDLERLMDSGSFQAIQQEATPVIHQVVKGKSKIPVKTTVIKSTRDPYRPCSPLQIQQLLDLVIEQGMPAR